MSDATEFNLKCTVCGEDALTEHFVAIVCTKCESRWTPGGRFVVAGPHRVELGDWVEIPSYGFAKAEVQIVGTCGYTVRIIRPSKGGPQFLTVGRNQVVKLDRRPFQIADVVRVMESREIGIVTGALEDGVNVHLAERGETVHFSADELELTR